jgi:hypothetical protein
MDDVFHGSGWLECCTNGEYDTPGNWLRFDALEMVVILYLTIYSMDSDLLSYLAFLPILLFPPITLRVGVMARARESLVPLIPNLTPTSIRNPKNLG